MKPFGNIVSLSILCSVIGLILLGAFLMFLGSGWTSWIGLAMVVAGASIWFAGETSLKKDPPTAGLLHFWNRPIKIGGKPVSVGGKTLTANWFPFYVSLVESDMSNHDKDFPVTVRSLSNTNLDGRVSVTYRPHIDDLEDYVLAGNSNTEIDSQIDDIVTRVVRSEAGTRETDELITNTGPIADEIKTQLESSSFGIEILKVQVVLSPSQKVRDAMDSPTIEEYQRTAEITEYETNLKAAKDLQVAYAADPHRVGDVPSLETCLQQILTQRLIRDGKASEIKGAGRIFGVVGTSAPSTPTAGTST